MVETRDQQPNYEYHHRMDQVRRHAYVSDHKHIYTMHHDLGMMHGQPMTKYQMINLIDARGDNPGGTLKGWKLV
jgi:hypothetical protein